MKAVLISIADATHNDSGMDVLDTLMYEHFNNIPRTEVSDYLFELKSYGLIEISQKASGAEYGLVNIKKRIAAATRSASQIGYKSVEFLPSS